MQKIIHNAETIICPVRIFASRNSHLGTLCSLQPLKFEIYWFKNKILKFSLGHTLDYAVLFLILFSDRLHSLQQMLSRTFKLHNPDSLTWPIAHCGQLLCANIYGLARSAWFTLGQTWAMDIAIYCKYFDLHSLLGSHLGRLWNLQPAISHTLCLNVVDDFVVG